MKNIKTKYMGIELDNPIIIGACNIVADLDKIKKAEDSGAAAIVYKSLFEEQIQLENFQLDEKLHEFNDLHAEMVTIHPNLSHAGPEEHLLNLRKAKESISIPLFASLNAVNMETWIEYSKLLAETGIDGLELNFYQIPTDFDKTGKSVEDEQVSIVREIKKSVSIPVSVKLSPGYSNILNFIRKLDEAGTDGLILFNSFFQPDININTEKHIKSFNLSNEGDYRESLRYSGVLFDNIKADICSSRGVFRGADVIKLLLSGSSCVQVVSILYKSGLEHIERMKQDLSDWMEMKNYRSISEFQGNLSKNKLNSNPFIYKRAQYVDLLLNSEDLFGIPN